MTLIVALLTTTIPSDRLFAGFLSVSVIAAIAGILLLLLWWRSHNRTGDLLMAIKARMPAEGTSAEPESSGEATPPPSRWRSSDDILNTVLERVEVPR